MGDFSDWLLTRAERGNDQTRIDDAHPDRAWSEGNLVRPLIHGVTYFRELHERVEATREGDLIFFTDWQGDADELLIGGDPDSAVVDVLARADERGVDVRGLIWRSHMDKIGFFARQNRTLGEQLQDRGAEALLDMRVRNGGSHHQKFVVIRHRDDATRDVAFVGGIDLAHSRRDDERHLGDPQAQPLAAEYGEHPPWHDVQVAIQGPAVHDVETVFRERWEDPNPLSRNPIHWFNDKIRRLDLTPDPLPAQAAPPPPVEGGTHVVQLLRTYPDLRMGLDYPFANGGERSVARGYSKAIKRASSIIYVEDQYYWGHKVADPFVTALREHPDLHVVVVLPVVPDLEGGSRQAQLLGREYSLRELIKTAPDRVAAFGIENDAGTPVYVHAKVCIMDDVWASVGSDNFNRRSWTHDSELSAVVVDREGGDHSAYARRLRLRLMAEHLGRLGDVDEDPDHGNDNLLDVMADCVDAAGAFAAFRECATALDDWHSGGRRGPRPPGRLRWLHVPDVSAPTRWWARVPLRTVHDPDGRPRALRGTSEF